MAFQPHYGTREGVAMGVATQITFVVGKGDKTMYITNAAASSGTVYFRTGNSANGPVTADGKDMSLLPGVVAYIAKPQDHDSIAMYNPGPGISIASAMSGEGG